MEQKESNFTQDVDGKKKAISEAIHGLDTHHSFLIDSLSNSIDRPLYTPIAMSYIITLCKVDNALGHNQLYDISAAILKGVVHGVSGYNSEDGEYDKIIIKNK